MSLHHLAPCLLALLASAASVLADKAPVKDAACDCFKTNGSREAYFSHHRFFDFRSLSEYSGVPDIIRDEDDSTNAEATSDYFKSDEWNDVWGTQAWNNSASLDSDTPVLMINSLNNVYIEDNDDDEPASDTWLTLRTSRLKHFQSAAEVESISSDYLFLSMRMYARTSGSAGACTAMFTYRDAEELADVQEADIEMLTKDPENKIQYTNQPSFTTSGKTVDQSTLNVSTPAHAGWGDWAVHRLDWTPKDSTWYINGQQVASISFQTPRDPSQVVFNSWSNGGEWTGNMTVGGVAYLQIQWFEMVYNMSSSASKKRDDEGCKTVCSIDDSPEIGKAVIMDGADDADNADDADDTDDADSAAASRLASRLSGVYCVVWIAMSIFLATPYL